MVNVKWHWVSSGARPVPGPAATPIVWGATAVSATALCALFASFGLLNLASLPLAAVCALAALTSWRGRVLATPGTAVIGWLVLNALTVPPVGQVTWTASRDPVWLGLLLGAATISATAARLAHAHAAYRRLTPGEYEHTDPVA